MWGGCIVCIFLGGRPVWRKHKKRKENRNRLLRVSPLFTCEVGALYVSLSDENSWLWVSSHYTACYILSPPLCPHTNTFRNTNIITNTYENTTRSEIQLLFRTNTPRHWGLRSIPDICQFRGKVYKNNSERPVDALAVKKVNHWLTDNLKSRDASASKKTFRTLSLIW